VKQSEQTSSIDRSSFEPAYVQLVNILQGQIASGEFRSGERLPSESQLCRRYRVSPMTVRRAINILLQHGLVSTTQGRGTFVKPMELSTVMFGLDELRGIFGRNNQNKVKLLEVSIRRADRDVAARLDLAPGDRVILIRRLIMKETEPLLYHQEYLIYDPTRPVVEEEMEVTALHGLFAGTGKTGLKRGELAIEATVLGKEEAALLMAPARLPSFRLEHLFYDFDNHPVSWGFFLCRGDRMRFRAAVGLGDRVRPGNRKPGAKP
jgi:GntR family transcriptional regulator